MTGDDILRFHQIDKKISIIRNCLIYTLSICNEILESSNLNASKANMIYRQILNISKKLEEVNE